MTHRVDPDTAKKNGWTAEMQTIKLASSSHGMRLSFARLVNDEHEMRKMGKTNITGFEIEELFEYLTNSQAGSAEDLVYSIARVRGTLTRFATESTSMSLQKARSLRWERNCFS